MKRRGSSSMSSTNRKCVLLSVAVIVAALGPAPASWACYSGLVLIPTADVTGPYIWALDLQWQGYSRALRTDQLIINTEFGFGERLELGVDVDATSGSVENRALFNAKYVFVSSDAHRFAMAAGVQNVGQRFTPVFYLVATKDWGVLRTHAGVQHDEDGGRNELFMGVDRSLGERWQIMADYTAGDQNAASAGVSWMGGGWQVLLGAQWPNAGGPPVAVVHVIFTGAFRRGRG